MRRSFSGLPPPTAHLYARDGQLEKRGITPEISLPEGPLYRTVDRYAVSRVFGNIISNAVKYSDGDLSVLLSADNSVSTRIKTLTPCFQKKS